MTLSHDSYMHFYYFNFSEKLIWNNQNAIEFPELISHAPAGGFESVVHSMTKYFVTYRPY